VVALAPWHVQLLVVDVDCEFFDSTPTTIPYLPTSVHVPQDEPTSPIATPRQFHANATSLQTYLTEARTLIRSEMNVKIPHGKHLISGLVDCATIFDFV
jgi:hypothetical protein